MYPERDRDFEGIKDKSILFFRAFVPGPTLSDWGEKEKAIDNLKKAEGMFREMGMNYWLGKAQEVLAAL